LSDFEASLTASNHPEEITLDARGRLLTASHKPPPNGEVRYHLIYRLAAAKVEIVASAEGAAPAPLRFILPVISRHEESVERLAPDRVRIAKANGRLIVETDAPAGFDAATDERTFNLVPGFECLPFAVALQPGKECRIELSVEDRAAQA